jgi:3-hydroxyisobutyrate dehydrogenase
MRLGFAGLGLMGLPMASNLLRAGLELRAYNRSSAAREALEELGGHTFEQPATLFEVSDCVFLMLANDGATDAVLGRSTPDFPARVAGKLIVNMGTHAPAWSKRLEEEVRKAGGRFVEAPVSGSRQPAEAGELVVMLAGEADAIQSVRHLMKPMCREVVVTGAVPSAMACKMAVNLYLIASVAALAEALSLARELGVKDEIFGRVIGSGPLGSEVARAKLLKMMSRDFAPQAAIRDVRKNAALVSGAAAATGIDAGLLDLARRRFDAAADLGNADLDMAAVITASQRGGGKLDGKNS